MKKQKETIYYYQDLLNDEFGPSPPNRKKISGNYKYNRDNIFVRFFDFISYRLILTPIAFIYVKLMRRTKIVNKKLLKEAKKEGAFIYANHTHPQSDAFMPNIAFFPRKVSMIVNSANVSLPILGNMTKAWGALPLPEDYLSTKNFLGEVALRIKRKGFVVIYPEAHLWPYYTGIRPFGDKSFVYPYKHQVKTYSLTTTYQTTKKGKLKTVVYIDGPFMIKDDFSKEENMHYLRNKVYEAMVERSKRSTFQMITYKEYKK